MSDAARRLRERVVDRAVNGPGIASRAARRAAFENQAGAGGAAALIDKVVRHAWKVTDEDVAATKAAGVREDEVFELTVCAALGAATRQLRAALAALDLATTADSVASAGPAKANDPAAHHDGRNT
jgi:hypothetical protein